jgi:ubiquinone/menaquinone biosynthesis methyltransferase
MFTSIAPRYDLLNHVLSFNVDRMWWRRTARTFRHILSRSDARVLDLCCGTGDMTFALRRQAGNNAPQILGADFSHAMLRRATAKSAEAKQSAPGWIEADALNLPLPNAQFDLVTSAFGFRNLADYDAGLREIVRVLRPGGECGILDFGEPKGAMGGLYRIYFKQVLPDLGRARSLRLSACVGRTLSRAAGTADAHETGRLRRSDLDAVHVRDRRTLLGENAHVATAAVACPEQSRRGCPSRAKPSGLRNPAGYPASRSSLLSARMSFAFTSPTTKYRRPPCVQFSTLNERVVIVSEGSVAVSAPRS